MIPTGAGLTPTEIAGLETAYRTIRGNPLAFFRRELGRDMWWRQRQVLELLRDHDRVAVASANAVGKTFIAAGAGIWYLNSQALGYVVTTGASWLSLKKTLWPEIHRILSGAPNRDLANLGQLNELEWKIRPHWGAFAVSPKTPEMFAGYRTPHGVLVIVDEASGLSYEIMEAIEGLCSSQGSKILMIGNPLRPMGPFFDSFTSPAWHTMSISALETPNYITGRNIIPGLATRAWVEEKRITWGEDSPAYRARVLGQFPDTASDVVISLNLAEAAAGLHEVPAEGEVRFGVDVARYGDDDSVIQIVKGKTALEPIVIHGQNTMAIAGRVVHEIQQWKPKRVNVDVIGVGGGVVDRLEEVDNGKYADIVYGVNVGMPPNDEERYLNVRAEGWYIIKDWLKAGGKIWKDRAIIGELCSVKYKYSSTGKLQLEAKEKTKERLGRSPDKADALMLALVEPKPKKVGGLW